MKGLRRGRWRRNESGTCGDGLGPFPGRAAARHHLSVSFTPGWAQLWSEELGQGLRPWETGGRESVGLVSDGVDWNEEEDSRRKSAEVWPHALRGEKGVSTQREIPVPNSTQSHRLVSSPGEQGLRLQGAPRGPGFPGLQLAAALRGDGLWLRKELGRVAELTRACSEALVTAARLTRSGRHGVGSWAPHSSRQTQKILNSKSPVSTWGMCPVSSRWHRLPWVALWLTCSAVCAKATAGS